jgi:hypothetical protein
MTKCPYCDREFKRLDRHIHFKHKDKEEHWKELNDLIEKSVLFMNPFIRTIFGPKQPTLEP